MEFLSDMWCSRCGVPGNNVISCTNQSNEPHRFCQACFNVYASVAFKRGGAYCQAVTQSKNIESGVGNLPCPFFQSGDCTCTSIALTAVFPILTEDVLEQWRITEGKLAVAVLNEQRFQTEERKEKSVSYHMQILLKAVHEAIRLGRTVACPRCSHRVEKDSACMHIACEKCRCSWCYCCGRERGILGGLCHTCDKKSMFIHGHLSWMDLPTVAGRTETMGETAVREFHRRRIAYFLRRISRAVPRALWAEFLSQHSALLQNVPSVGRQISEKDIKEAKPPLFAPTTRKQLRWIRDIDSITTDLQENLVSKRRFKMDLLLPQLPLFSGLSSAVTTGQRISTWFVSAGRKLKDIGSGLIVCCQLNSINHFSNPGRLKDTGYCTLEEYVQRLDTPGSAKKRRNQWLWRSSSPCDSMGSIDEDVGSFMQSQVGHSEERRNNWHHTVHHHCRQCNLQIEEDPDNEEPSTSAKKANPRCTTIPAKTRHNRWLWWRKQTSSPSSPFEASTGSDCNHKTINHINHRCHWYTQRRGEDPGDEQPSTRMDDVKPRRCIRRMVQVNLDGRGGGSSNESPQYETRWEFHSSSSSLSSVPSSS